MENILIVDDDVNVLASLQRILSPYFKVVPAMNGDVGLWEMQRTDFAVVLSDYSMPIMDGIKFLELVKDQAPSTIRMLLTGNQERQIAIDAINKGNVYRFFSKPWDNDELRIAIQQAAELYRMREERKRLVRELQDKTNQLADINRNLEHKVEERTQLVLQADRMATLGQTAGQIGHEIKNVISVQKGRLQLLYLRLQNSEELSHEKKSIIELDKGFDRLSFFANNLQSLGRSKQLSFENVNLLAVLQETVSELCEVGILKYYKIIEAYHEEPLYVRGDSAQLEQAFVNLLMNAHQAMKEKGTLNVSVTDVKDDGYAVVSISDTGCGIPADHIKKVFDPFFTTKPEGEGTGLGMVVVKQIIEGHGGSVNVNSKVGEGTTVNVFLPIYHTDKV